MKLRLHLILRRYQRHPWQLVLGIAGIALGVGVVLAIDLANASAERAFAIAEQSVSGAITHRIVATAGAVDESFYADLRTRQGLRGLMPVVTGWVRTGPDAAYRLIGFDPVAALEFSGGGAPAPVDISALSLLREPGAVLITHQLARALSAGKGAVVDITVNGRSQALTVAGLLPGGDDVQSRAYADSFLTDIATAQEILGMPGRLSRIDLTLDAAQADRLSSEIAPPLQLLTAAARGNAMEQITRAFRVNLTALSLLALVIGAFLIFNTLTIGVLQRRDLIATVRTLGLTRRELMALLVGEALLLAIAGMLCGAAMGMGLSHYLVRLVSRTISDLYFVNEVRSVHLNGWSFAKAALLGLAASLLAVYFPARDATRIAPELVRSRSRLESQNRSRQRPMLAAALAFAAAAFIILALSGKSIVAGFVALALIILAFALISPLILVGLVMLAQPILRAAAGMAGRMACRGVIAALSRAQVAVTALAIAISATIGVSIMIDSFRASVQDWLAGLLQADVYISVDNGGTDAAIDPELLERLRGRPGVAKVATARWRDLWVQETPIQLLIRDLDAEMFSHYRFRGGGGPERWRQFAAMDSVIVSEPYAYHHSVKTGDRLTLPTGKGSHDFTIAGVYIDYSSDRGVVSMHEAVYARWWTDSRIDSVSLYLEATRDLDDFIQDLRRDLASHAGLIMQSNRDLRELSMRIFDRTFVITEVLRAVTVVIAFIGILGALLAIQLERDREFGVLRAFGMTPGELKKLVLSESGLMGTVAGVMAIPLGIILAAVLIYVINRRSFGWMMDFVLNPGYLASALILGGAAGILAGVVPAWRMSALQPARVLHDE